MKRQKNNMETQMIFTSRQIGQWLNTNQSENLVLVPDDILLEYYARQPRLHKISYCKLMGELVLRYHFSLNQKFEEILSQYISQRNLDVLRIPTILLTKGQRLEKLFINVNSSIVDAENSDVWWGNQILSGVIPRLDSLVNDCAGIIPVLICDNEGAGVPFALRNHEPGQPWVVDLRGKEIPQWSESVAKLGVPYQVELLISTDDTLNTQIFTGDSLQLPVVMACWRKENELPQYDPFTLFTTGQVVNGCVAPVKSIQKWKYIHSRYGDQAVFFSPCNSAEPKCLDSGYIILAEKTSLETVKELLRIHTEKQLSAITIQYIINRFPQINSTVLKDVSANWDRIIAVLDTFLQSGVINPELDRENARLYLDILIAKSFAFCHQGRTDKARKINEQATEFAAEHNLMVEYLILSIGEIVSLQDDECFEEILLQAPAIAKVLNSVSGSIIESELNDLWMRYHGTMGQSHTAGTILGLDGFSSQSAKEHFQQAITFARKLNNPDEISRDLNYLHLWYAFFSDDWDEEEYYYHQAKNYNPEGLSLKSREVNLEFLTRQHGMAIYRRVLKGDPCPELDSSYFSDPNIEAEGFLWLKALTKKYQGTFEATRQEYSLARDCFEKSIEYLSSFSKNSYLFAFFRMTAAAQGYESLRNTPPECENYQEYQAQAETWRKLGLSIFAQNNDFTDYRNAAQWKAFLEADTSIPFANLALKYHY